MGFVDPAVLSQRLFTPSPLPGFVGKSTPLSRPTAFNFPSCSDEPRISVEKSKIEFPKSVNCFEKSSPNFLTVPTGVNNLDEKKRLVGVTFHLSLTFNFLFSR